MRLVATVLGTWLLAGGVVVAQVEDAPAPVPSIDVQGLRPHVLERLEEARAKVVADRTKAPAWRELGELFHAHQFFEAAEVALTEARRLAPDDFRTVYVLALTADKTVGRPEPTIELFRAALALDPKYGAAWRNLGTVYQRDGWFEEAGECFEQALELDPDFVAARLGLGQVLLSTGEVERAVEELERVAAVIDGDRAVNAALAQAYQRTGQVEKARELARRAVRQGNTIEDRDPILEDVRLLGSSTFDARLRAEKALSEGRWQDAVRDLELFLEGRSGSIGVRYHLARARAQLGDMKGAREDLKLVLEADPDNVDAMVLNARLLLLGANKVGAARKHLDRVLELEPLHVEAQVLLATSEVKRQNYREACNLFDRVVAQLASSHATPSAYRLTALDRMTRGMALLGAERPNEAVEQLEAVVKDRPALAEAHFRLGEAYEALGRVDDARASFEQAGRLDSSLPVEQALRRLAKGR